MDDGNPKQGLLQADQQGGNTQYGGPSPPQPQPQTQTQPKRSRQRQLQPQNNLGKILKKSVYVIAFLMVVLAFVMSAIAISKSNETPVKYPTYERIGKKECPDIQGTTTIYQGVTISYSFYNNTPTSYAGFRCMPLDKEYINYSTDKYTYKEEQVNSGNVTGYITFTPSNHHDAACSVCMVEGRGSIMVMPGTDQCLDSSWTMEYIGYLMTGYTCVDTEMEGIGALKDPDRDTNLRHEVISSKVSEYYQDHKVLSCVVCSK